MQIITRSILVMIAIATSVLVEAKAAITNTISPGQIVAGSISAPGQSNYYTFTAASNDVITLTLLRTNSSAGNPTLTLYDPTGAVTTLDRCAVGGLYVLEPGRRLTQSGTYIIVVRECELNDTFDYTLCMIKNPGPNFPEPGEGSETLLPRQARAAQITVGDCDAFAFRGIAGDMVMITLLQTSGSGQGPVLELQAPDGTVVATASGASSARIRVPCLSQTGTYLIAVRDDGLNEAFGYELTLLQSPVVPPSSSATQYLAIFECTNHVIVRWETNSVGFVLETTPVLPAPNWTPVSRIPQVIADHYYLDEGAVTNQSQFYRLRCTNCPSGFVGQ